MEKNIVAIIGSAGIPCRYGGFETLAENLANGLSDNFYVYVACSSNYYNKSERAIVYKHVKRVFTPIKPNGIQSIIYDVISILKVINKTRFLLILGSSAAFLVPLLRVLKPKVKIVYHPDGIEWQRGKWNILAKLFLRWSSKTGAKHAHKIVVDNSALLPIYSKYATKLHEISYGGNQYIPCQVTGQKNYWLTIARAEPENNLDLIASCFAGIPNEKWVLVSNIATTAYGRKLSYKYKNFKNISFIDSEYRNHKLAELLGGCKGYIHGHSSGGTNPSLVSAMWGAPFIVCHNNPFNRSTTKNLAVYFTNEINLAEIITSKGTQYKPQTMQIKLLAENEYSWKKITDKYQILLESM
ncbi:MAG: DUF1972 domain-containing protein [Bacteroidales bacterium]|nr:DUF1972 domain-containing protein [Bacteroidales bacterium]